MMALKVETENTTRIALNTDTDEWWLWTSNEDAMMALNAKRSETWLWTSNWGVIMALNAEIGDANRNVKLESDDGSELQTEEW